jgi:putative proteasome-type protease
MTYCLGLTTRYGLVLASDSRTKNSEGGVNICRKMHIFEKPGERVFLVATSGDWTLSQSILTLLRRDFEQGIGLAQAETMYEAARMLGSQVRRASEHQRAADANDGFKCDVHFILGGQIGTQPHEMYLIYPQGNPLCATEDSPFLQLGEHRYGRSILVRGIRYHETSLAEAAKYALISMDSTMGSNAAVGPPIDIALYPTGCLEVNCRRRLTSADPDFREIHTQWGLALRRGVASLPEITFPPDAG